NLLVTQSVDRIEPGCPLCRKHSEYDADAHRYHDRDNCKSDWDTGVDFHREGGESTEREANQYSQRTAKSGQRGCFDQELKEYLLSRCTQGFTDADLASAARDRHHHDCHHANTADQEPYARQHDHNQEEHSGDLVE